MNITKSLIARIEEARTTNKNPCKNYATESAADKATAIVAKKAADHFQRNQDGTAAPARYIVVYVESWGRWVGGVDLTELMARPSSTGGYLGICGNVFVF